MELFKIGFIPIRVVDIIDISVVTFLFYKLYELLRGSIALRILMALAFVVVFWWLVTALDMLLLGNILDRFLEVGMIALIVIFAGEIRRFLLILGKNTIIARAWEQIFQNSETTDIYHEELIGAIEEIKRSELGALIAIVGQDALDRYRETGDNIGAELSERLLFSIFLKDGPLHDGAVIIDGNRIASARCVLPISSNPKLPPELGLRHRAALGLAEASDAFVIAVSEERQEISIAKDGVLQRDVDLITLETLLKRHLSPGKTET